MDGTPNWPNHHIREFIQSYSKHPLLYDVDHPNYRNKKMKNKSWNSIKNEISVEYSVFELKRKKDNLMATYRNLNNKIENSGGVYKPSWFAYDIMDSFLGPLYRRKFIKQDPDDISWNNSPESYVIAELNPDSRSSSDINQQTEVGSDDYLLPENHMKKRKYYDPRVPNGIYNATEFIEEDELSLYGRLLVLKLRTMDIRTRKMIMHQIDNLIYDTELKKIDTSIPTDKIRT